MARTLDQIVQEHLGAQLMELLRRETQIAMLQEQVTTKDAQIETLQRQIPAGGDDGLRD